MQKSTKCQCFCVWFGHGFTLFMELLPPQQTICFKIGPFAWNGLIAFWVAFSVFGMWFPVAFYLLRKAVLRLEVEQR